VREQGKLWLSLHILILVFSLSSVCSKLAARQEIFTALWFLFYGMVLVILAVYAIFWQQIIKRMPLSTAYANKAATVIWGQLWGLLLFRERITAGKLAGAVLIVLGIVLYARASREEAA